MRPSAEVASAASVLIFLGEVVFGGETLNLYKCLAAREIESALLVLRENLDDYLIADIYNVLNLFGALNVELADVNHTLYSGYYLNKRAEAHKACNDSLVISVYLGAVSYCIDNEDCLLCIVKVNRGNKYLTVLAHVNLAVALGSNLLNYLALLAYYVAYLIGVNLGGEHLWCPL